MNKLLDGKIALVTGGGTGIGFAIAEAFVAQGAFVYITGRRQKEIEIAAKSLGENARGLISDVTVKENLEKVYSLISEEQGRVDIVVANAGVSEMVSLSEITEQHYYEAFDTNVKGVVFTVKESLSILSDGAAIILIGSTTGVKGAEKYSIYSASKAAVRNLARTWILELGPRNIRVNTISPGPIVTEMSTGTKLPGTNQSILDFLAPSIPLQRPGQPYEVAQVAVFLASSQSSFVNGIDLFVDGGFAQY